MRFSTGAVRDYIPNGRIGPDLPLTIPEARAFASWYLLSGHTAVTRWENGDVWGDDFRDNGGDLDPSGGSELPEIAARTAGLPGQLRWLFPQQSVGDAWMDTGTIDIQSGCSAVALAVGANRDDAIDRRENERVTDRRVDPAANWAAWKWRTA
jgi:hypothetical protein